MNIHKIKKNCAVNRLKNKNELQIFLKLIVINPT